MSACHGSLTPELCIVVGGLSSSKSVEPHFDVAQSGASRSVSPERERMDLRALEAR